MHRNHTVISEFRVLNRKIFSDCPDLNPFLQISVSPFSNISDEEYVNVTVGGVLFPSKLDWVAMVAPAYSDVSSCLSNFALYVQTGDLSQLPLLCHYPVKVSQ
ncbi:uncharacterized protein LOC132167482 [Corylus avellana]|uniref:uncharacterized protein LOC132167482 n=1 Tax=Corylus avellana TaxID=13451 RepID=UPI00286B16E1|nr:uncharacterized protein LOC132167482 [Corylus avellana]